MGAIFKREFKSYFATPVGYIVIAAFYFFLGLFFYTIYQNGAPAVENVIVTMATISTFIMPILTMRLMSDDRRLKVDQVLITAPVKLVSIVLGKFFAALAVFAIGFAPSVVFEFIVARYVTVNWLSFLYAVIGILLLGSVLIAIGMFISCLTESAAISAILTLVINILALYMSNFAQMIKIEWLSNFVNRLAFLTAFEKFGENIFSVADIVYFVSIAVLFLFLSVRSLEKRRWA